MNITDNLKSQLLITFKTEKNLISSIKKKEIYKFKNFNSNQISKVFEIEQTNIFYESNARKHLIKIFDMIKSNFFSPLTNNYLNVFLNPTINENIINKRRLALKQIEFNFSKINEKNLKQIISSIENLKLKIGFNNRILTLDKLSEEVLYDKYKLHCEFVTKLELEQIFSEEVDPKIIIISEEDLFLDLPVFDLKEFEKIIIGNILKTNKSNLLNLMSFFEEVGEYEPQIKETVKQLTDYEFNFDIDFNKLKEILEENFEENLKDITNKTLLLEQEVDIINEEIKTIISKKQLSLQGDELLNLLNSGDLTSLQNKFREDTKEIVAKKEQEIIDYYLDSKISVDNIFENSNYPLKVDEAVKDEILKKIDMVSSEIEFNYYEKLGKFSFKQIKELFNFIYFFDFLYGIKKFENKFSLIDSKIGNEFTHEKGKNIYIDNANPVDYSIGGKTVGKFKLNEERVCILTGANSGGKTTMLEMNLQSQILTTCGLGIAANKNSKIKLFEEVIYLKKFTGTVGSGAFEQTIRNLIEILDSKSTKLILIDEFEAVTEPGAAARILIQFLREIIKSKDNYCIAASHLGQEIQQFIKKENILGMRIDGISAEGLDEKGNLITNHQPQFYKLGKSTPELILKRIIMDDSFWKNKSSKSKEILKNIL